MVILLVAGTKDNDKESKWPYQLLKDHGDRRRFYPEEQWIFYQEIKKANRTSHRYNRLPLLPSGPGGFSRSWSCRLAGRKDTTGKSEIVIRVQKFLRPVDTWGNIKNSFPRVRSLFNQPRQIEVELHRTCLREPVSFQFIKNPGIRLDLPEVGVFVFIYGYFRRPEYDRIHLHQKGEVCELFFKILVYDIAALAHTYLI